MLIGIIIADGEGPGAGAARALLPIAASTLIETVARTLARAGAERILIVNEESDTAIAAAAGRLSRSGVSASLARDAVEAAAAIPAAAAVLLIDAGVLVDAETADALVAAGPPALLALADSPANARWERIDAAHRWAGAVLINAATFSGTAAMLGEWALASTLVRRALQESGRLVRPPAGGLVACVADAGEAAVLDRALARRTAEAPRGWVDRLTLPIGRALAPLAIGARIDPVALGWGGAVTTLIGAVVAGAFSPMIGLMVAAAGLAAAATARRLALLSWRMGAIRRGEAMRHGALALGLAMLAVNVGAGSAAAPAFAAALAAFLWLEAEQRRLFDGLEEAPAWRPTPDGLVLGLAPFALVGAWTLGLAALAGWAFAGVAAAQRLSARTGRG